MDKEILLTLHLLVLAFVAWNTFHADHLGFKWIKGSIPMLDAARIRKYHYRVWAGLLGMIATGFLMF